MAKGQASPEAPSGRSVNLAGVAVGFQPIPNNKYPVVFAGGEWGDGPKAEYFSADFTVVGSDGGEFDGRHIYKIWSLSEKALPVMKGDFVALGKDADELEGEIDVDEIIAELNGASCVADVYIDTKNGYNNNKIRKLIATGEE